MSNLYSTSNKGGITVRELIDFLETQDQNSTVLMWGYKDNGYMPVNSAIRMDPVIDIITGEIKEEVILLE